MTSTALSTVDFLKWIERNAPEDVIRLSQHMQYGDEVKYVSLCIDPGEYRTIELIHFTDLQFGHICCNEKRVIEYRDWILSKANRFVLFGGDMVDAATQLSKASPYENKWEPSVQCIKLVEALLPLRHRVLGYVGGNHERRSSMQFGTLGRFVAMLLRVPFSSGQQFIDIHYGEWSARGKKKRPFQISLWHGAGSAKTKGAKCQMIDRYMNQADSDLYLVGHLHDCMLVPGWRQVRRNNRIELEKKYGGMSSSFLDFFGTYAEVMGLTPADTMMLRAIVEPSGHFEVTAR